MSGVVKNVGGALAVSQRAAGANLSVDVAVGRALYEVTTTLLASNETHKILHDSTAVVNVPIATADATNPRIDIIVMKTDMTTAPDSSAGNIPSITKITGTPAGTPAAPATPANHLKLADIAVAAGATTVVTANITDRRAFVTVNSQELADLARATVTTALRTDLNNDAPSWLGTVAGTNTLTGSATPAATAYAAGQRFAFVVANANSGAVTINVNGLGAKNLYGPIGTALAANELTAGGLVSCRYDGTRFVMDSPKLSTQGTPKIRVLASAAADSTSVGASSTAKADYDTTCAVAALSVAAGDTFRVRAAGLRNGSGTPVLTIRLELGSQVLLTFASGADNAESFFVDCLVTVRTTGASGTVVAHGHVRNTGAAFPTPVVVLTTASGAIDFTASQTLKLTAQFGASSASNNTKLTQFEVLQEAP